MKTNQKGFSVVEGVLILIVVGLLAFIGYTVIKTRDKKAATTTASTSTSAAEKPAVATTKTYKNAELDVSFEYPVTWGDATMTEGTFPYSFQKGSYKHIVFSSNSYININFVTGAYSSPLDGCPSPTMSAKHELYGKRASLTGWDEKGYKEYNNYQGDGPVFSSIASDYGYGWTKLSSKDKVLAFKQNYRKLSVTDESCSETPPTQAEIDEYNSYASYDYFAANFSKGTVKGVNAQYDSKDGKSTLTLTQMTDTLNSLK